MLVLAAEHQRSYLAHRSEGCELFVWQDVHFYLIVEEPIALCLAEFYEDGRQPEVICLVIYADVEVSDSIEV